ncbi:MAG: hypothetical protein FJ319_06865 [SAR202 cluster bacterium]|nr:hypothetical protein [SAR202 cluster bacterium]
MLTWQMRRVVLLVNNIEEVTAFYRDVLELKPIFNLKIPPPEWIEFNAGNVRLALEQASGMMEQASNFIQLMFYAEDLNATREELIRRGVKVGEIKKTKDGEFFDSKDPEGHIFRISNRK